MSEEHVFLAVDLGASSGRVIAGRFDGTRLDLEEVYRFPNGPVEFEESYRWDIEGLFKEVKTGLGKAGQQFGDRVVSLGVDTWGVDYGLLDNQGDLLDRPYAYRDPRNVGMPERAFAMVPQEEMYAATGIQTMDFNTVYQLLAEKASGSGNLDRAHDILFVPDLLNYWLTGLAKNEYTIASTGQLLDARRRCWADTMIGRLGLPTRLFGNIVNPGAGLGVLLPEVAEETGLPGCNVVAVGSHDTASAVAAVPFKEKTSAYLSSGTWSIMGIESGEPIINTKSREYAFSNEGGVCDTIRVLKNICGLWLVQECRRTWMEAGDEFDFGTLARMAEEAPPFKAFVDPDDASFAAPCDMPARMAAFCERTGQTPPPSRGSTIRTALEGLAFRYRTTLEMLEDLAGHRLDRLHIVGGGVQNRLLSQFAANAINRPVAAGPVEATSIGNILLQMLAAGAIKNLGEGRTLVLASFETQSFEPRNTAAWEQAYRRFSDLCG